MPRGGWHTLAVHVTHGSPGTVDVVLDGTSVLSGAESFGGTGFGRVQVGETSTSHTGVQLVDDVLVQATPPVVVLPTAWTPSGGTDATGAARALTAADLAALSSADGTDWTVAGAWGGSTSPGTGQDLDGLACPAPGSCWAVGQKGTVVATSDGGRSWSSQSPGTTQDLLGTAFGDPTRGLLVGKHGTVAVTPDGGGHWQLRPAATSKDLWSVAWLDAAHAVAVGQSGTVLTTADGGAGWRLGSAGTSKDLLAVAALDPTHLVAVGKSGTVATSSDGGARWSSRALGSKDLYAVAARGTTVLAVGQSGTTLRSTDGGGSWSFAQAGGTDLLATSLAPGGAAWAAGKKGLVLVSADDGRTWASRSAGTSRDLRALVASSGTAASVVGDSGTALATGDAGATWGTPAGYVEWVLGGSVGSVSTVTLELVQRATSSPRPGTTARVLASTDGTTWTGYPLAVPGTSSSTSSVDLTGLIGGDPAALAGLRVRLVLTPPSGSTLRTAHDLVRVVADP